MCHFTLNITAHLTGKSRFAYLSVSMDIYKIYVQHYLSILCKQQINGMNFIDLICKMRSLTSLYQIHNWRDNLINAVVIISKYIYIHNVYIHKYIYGKILNDQLYKCAIMIRCFFFLFR